jgi:NAD(P)-dependent dehydrogenase (short-subunit alcohol dehydrogenase family)
VSADPRDAFDVSARVVVITGGGRGLGRAMSTGLARAGARIVAAGRTQSDLDETVAAIEADGGQAIGVRTDISNYSDGTRLVDAAVEAFGGIDVLINNAVDPTEGYLEDTLPEVAERVFRANVHGPLHLAVQALPHLRASGRGSVINVISAAVWIGGGGQGLYRSSKAALQSLTRMMAKEWAPDVRANTLAPGPFETSAHGGWTDEVREMMVKMMPIGRIGAFDEIVPHVLYLASDASSLVTGTDLIVDGGIINGRAGKRPVHSS